MVDIIKLEHELNALKQEYSQIEQQIQALSHEAIVSPFTLSKLKKDKIILRDKITAIEDQIYPDVIA